MNISRVSDEKNIPWISSVEESIFSQNNLPKIERLSSIGEFNDSVLSEECEFIEHCASNGEVYHYNVNWDKEAISHLKEYALACGMEISNFKEAEPKEITLKESSSNELVKTAEADNDPVDDLKSIWKDPFNIEERSDMSHMDSHNWAQVTKQNVLSSPSLDSGKVISATGGEDYNLNSDTPLASNQNSITNPNAIEELAKSSSIDNGERLKQENQSRVESKKENHKSWEQSKIEEMNRNDIVPKGVVFPTESLNANSGIQSNSQGVYSDFDPSSIPEKTEGEKIAENKQKYIDSIQREKVKDNWEKPSSESFRSISDDFSESLKNNLNRG